MACTHSASPFALAFLLALGGCAAAVKPNGADEARNALASLKADSSLAAQVPAALLDAELAVQAAALPTRDVAAGEHAVHVATRKIELARANAERQQAEAELKLLVRQREDILREGQSRELEIAAAQAQAASAAMLAQQQAALAQAASAQLTTDELRRQLDELQARPSDRGMVITLGDVLFAVGKSDLQDGATEQLDKLAGFMHRYVDRTLLIEGHTDARGSDEANLSLSQRRAESVKVYLIIQSVDSDRMTTVGRGSAAPVADNASAEGRQLNRRVEIIISNAPVATQ